ncbi:phospho-sugar mutase [Vibrio marisflavi]|uniref:Phosphoglucomutase n=1 Tax=Vibrio marisflavi CECT 7928 TaxID=634439 RepID=A0ABM9A1K3_9VIBR|nr:phospho-sugar mutase [Vibrio marisflavi]CAH0537682.1 Phosphoglucomutase [Vibrio marisflavi CECT 7928]
MTIDVTRWLERDPDPRTREELQFLIEENLVDEIEKRFKKRLEFGTAGLRGLMGCGPNRMNRLVIQETATGLGHYLIRHVENACSRGIVVGYDGRFDSKQFAHDTAAVLAALGIKVYLSRHEVPTPVVAFGVKHLDAAGAVVVTASHNPPRYNGFKVYWENGAQIIPPHDQGIAAEIERAAVKPIPLMSLDNAKKKGLLEWLSDEYVSAYRHAMVNSSLLANHTNPACMTIAYTALHGVGASIAEALLHDIGFTNVLSVPEQRDPEPSFPTVAFPNPEEKGAMDKVIEMAESLKAQVACANDPDADRFAVAVQQLNGRYKMLTGDQLGVLLGHYLLTKTDPSKQLVGNTIVSSRLLEKIAIDMGAEHYKTLTGFKWLSNMAMQLETEQHQFLFAYEEAIGYTIGKQVWDKDGLFTFAIFAQLAAETYTQNKTIWDYLEFIYRKYGIYLNAQKSIQFDPELPAIGDKLRANPPEKIAGLKVVQIEDFKASLRFNLSGPTQPLPYPASDVIIYYLEDQSRIIIRPSGTEPKVKCYYEVVGEMSKQESYLDAMKRMEEKMDALIEAHQESLD